MKKVINKDNISSFAYVNNKELLSSDVLAIVIEFKGLGAMTMYNETERGVKLGKENILYVIPYLNPWNWMNMDSIKETDCIIDCLKEIYGENLNVISTGMSMGGLCSLVFPYYSRHKVVGVVSNCPVCDLPYHYTERPDLPRTLYSAYFNEDSSDETINDALKKFSPYHLACDKKLPKIEYTIFHCECDHAVNIEKHSVKLVKEMNKYHHVDFITIANKDHCDLGEELKKYEDVIIKYCKNNY